MAQLQEVMQLWQNDAQFRADFKKNPVEALKKAQIDLNEADLKKVKEMLDRKDSQSDHLDERISK